MAGANRHDTTLFFDTLVNFIIDRPKVTQKKRQHLCADKGYDAQENRLLAKVFDYTAHIKSRHEEKEAKIHSIKYRPRRWVVERTHSWINRFRRLFIRWEKKSENYIAMLHLAFSYITLNAAGVLG